MFFTFTVNAQIYLELEAKTDLTFAEIVEQTEAYFDEVGREKGKGYKPFKRWEYEKQRSLDAEGRIVSRSDQMKSYNSFMKNNPSQKAVGIDFTDLGPYSQTNTSTWSSSLGRLSAIGLDPNNANHIIVGSPTGGIWKTTDGGTTWAVIYDYATNIDIRSLEISHANADHYYVGTSARILKSIDAGETWTAQTGGPVGTFNTITMDPTNANILLATNRFGRGIYRSSDGGDTWGLVEATTGDAFDIEFKPGNSNVVYASGAGFISKSTDNGATWTVLAGPWGGGVIMLAVTPHDANYIYALQETNGGYDATYRSTNSGTTWTVRSDNSSGTNNILFYNQSVVGGQAPRDMDIVVSPTDKDDVYVAGTELWKSTNGGTGFTKIADWLVASGLPFIHADVDLMYYSGTTLYVGSDGGLFTSTDAGATFTDKTTGINVRQFYRIGASQTSVDRVSGGSQDNGTGVLVGGIWKDYMGADGMETFIDWSNADIMYGNLQFGSLYKSTDGGNTTVGITQTESGANGEWVTPTEQDPTISNTLYQGKTEVYKSTNGAASWTTISAFANGDKCDEIEIAPSNNQVIYVSYGALLYKTTNGGTTWSANIGPGGYINYIDVHPTDPNKVVIAQFGAIMESTNGGTTWVDIKGNLPNQTYYCALYANDGASGIFLGGQVGIWYKDNTSGTNWVNQSGDMPTVQIRELEIRNGTLYVGTYGRGLWKGTLTPNILGMTCGSPIDLSMPGTFTAPGPSYGGGCFNCTGGATANANWYKFTPPFTGTINIGSCLAGEDTRLWIYSGSCGALTQIDANDDGCTMTHGNGTELFASLVENLAVVAGTPIYIEWDNRWSSNSFFWSLEYNAVACPPNFNGPNTLTGVQSTSMDFETNGGIASSQQITGATTVVDYDSGTDINLLANFEVVLGAVFNAFIDGCGGALIQQDLNDLEGK